MTTRDEIIFAAFHSLSAFCNAGFSNLPEGLSNPALLHGNQVIYLIMSVLIVTGGIGYPILVNARDALYQRQPPVEISASSSGSAAHHSPHGSQHPGSTRHHNHTAL